MKGNNEIVDNVMNKCKEGGEWSVDIEDYKCLGMYNLRVLNLLK